MSWELRSRLSGRLLMPAAYSLMGDRRMSLIRQALARDEWTPEQTERHRAERLSWLFGVCRAHNPYWREKFARFGLNPEGSDPLAELGKLPVLTKDEVRANWRQMRSSHLSDSQVIQESSSGSTGMPVSVYHSRYYSHLHEAMAYRSRAWMGIGPGDPYLSIHSGGRSLTPRRRMLRWLRTAVENGATIDALEIDVEGTGPRLRRAARKRPKYIHGYASSVVAMAQLARDLGVTWTGVKAVSTTSEQLSDRGRKLLREVFGAPVYDRYGSREAMNISMECPRGGYHIYADCNVVEFVPVTESDEAMHAVVVTPLDNEAMPLFRYRGGDSASPVAGRCECGRSLPLMTRVRGRIGNNFLLANGRMISGTYFEHFFDQQDGFRAYQFHQTRLEHIDLYVVPHGELSAERRCYLLDSCRKMHADHDQQFEVELHIVDKIPRRPGGKHLYTISDLLKHI